MIRLLESKPFLFFFRIICGRLWGSLAVEDHLRSILGIICGLGIICCWGSFAVLYRTQLQLRLWNLNICIEKVGAKCLLVEMTLVMTSLPLTRLFQCLFTFALIGGNLTAQ